MTNVVAEMSDVRSSVPDTGEYSVVVNNDVFSSRKPNVISDRTNHRWEFYQGQWWVLDESGNRTVKANPYGKNNAFENLLTKANEKLRPYVEAYLVNRGGAATVQS